MDADTVWQREFEEMFPFEETEDQLEAIEATKKDMESRRIMDRLICGDVGYGKTEIALRAAFKATAGREAGGVSGADHHSGAAALQYLCPANEGFPGAGGSAVAFPHAGRSMKKTLEDLKKGQVDVVIGTHRVLVKGCCTLKIWGC